VDFLANSCEQDNNIYEYSLPYSFKLINLDETVKSRDFDFSFLSLIEYTQFIYTDL